MVDLPRSRALVAFDPNGFLLPIQPVTPAGSGVWRFLHRTPVLIAIGLALLLVAVFASDLVGVALRSVGLGGRGRYAIPLVGSALVCASYWAFVRIVERRRRIDEFELPAAPQEIAGGAAAGLALFAAIVAVSAGLGNAVVTGSRADALLPALAAAAGGAVVQEIVMRGEMFRLIERFAGSWIALALSSGVFGAVQLARPDAAALAVAAAVVENGVLFAAVFMLTRRLWAGIGLHLGWNLAPALVAVETGDALGVKLSWPAVAIAGVACAMLLTLAAKRSRIVAPLWTRGRVRRRELAVEFG